jgi:hypothetical protein
MGAPEPLSAGDLRRDAEPAHTKGSKRPISG